MTLILIPSLTLTLSLTLSLTLTEVYAARLRGTGAQATFIEAAGAVHAFCVYAGTPLALGDSALDEAVAYVRFALRKGL